MRGKGIVTIAAALAGAQMAAAQGEMPAAVGLIETPALALAGLAAIGQAGFRISHSFRLRINVDDRDDVLRNGVSPLHAQIVDPSRQRRLSSTLDYYPIRDIGLYLSAGMRHIPRRARWTPGSLSNIDIFMPKMTSPLRSRSNIARTAPMAVAGWSGMLGPDASLSLSAGAIEQHGSGMKATSASIVGLQAMQGAWSRIGGVAQIAFGLRF